MAAKTETLENAATVAWAASTSPTLALDAIGVVTRYDLIHELVPSATFVGANQPDGLYRPFQNIQIRTGSDNYFSLPSDPGGQGGVLQHILNRMDGLGVGHTGGGITAPDRLHVPIKLTFHAGVYPRRRDGLDNPYDLSGLVPVAAKGSAQLDWTINLNSVADDSVTISSGVLRVFANRVLGNYSDIRELMTRQNVARIMDSVGCQALIPAWQTDVLTPTGAQGDYGYLVDVKMGAFLKRASILAQNESATLALRAADLITQLTMSLPGTQKTYFKHSTSLFTCNLPAMEQLAADDVTHYGGSAPKGVYPVDFRVYGETETEQVLGLDLRAGMVGYARWGMTLTEWASGDNILILSERMAPYNDAI